MDGARGADRRNNEQWPLLFASYVPTRIIIMTAISNTEGYEKLHRYEARHQQAD